MRRLPIWRRSDVGGGRRGGSRQRATGRNMNSRINEARVFTFFLMLFLPVICDAQAPFGANELRFNTVFAKRNADPSLYCLLGTGFVRVIRSEAVDSIVTGWLAAHPNAQVVPVTTSPS